MVRYVRCIHIVQPIADRVVQNLEIISKQIPTNQNSAHGIYDSHQVINDQSHENPGTSGTHSKVFRNNLKMLCHPICNWLYLIYYAYKVQCIYTAYMTYKYNGPGSDEYTHCI